MAWHPVLDSRLGRIYQMVTPGSRVADIGTDHGYLIALLALDGVISSGYACDINRQPLQKAQETIRRCGVENRITTVLSDGLQALSPSSVDECVLAGMGGDLIGKILTDVPWSRNPELRFLLQPMSKEEHLRALLDQEGFHTEEESAVAAGRFVYPVMAVRYGGKPLYNPIYTHWTGLIGAPGHPLQGDETAYLQKQSRRLLAKAQGLATSAQGQKQAEELLLAYRQIMQKLGEST